MRFCNKCKVSVSGERKRCPLCQNVLTGEGSPEAFPYVPTVYRQFNLFFRILILISVCAAVVSVAVNLMIPQSGWWSVFVVLGIACLWLIVSFAIRKRRNILKNTVYQVVVIFALCLLWDLLTGWHRWSLDFVLPIDCIASMLALSILAGTLHMRAADYLIYICIAALFGIVPIILYLTGSLKIIYPSVICTAVSVISLTAMLVFQGDVMVAELKRRLHV